VTEIKGKRRVLIVTGEASGDLHGSNLIKASRKIDPEIDFFGVGGKLMADAGCDILIPGEELAVMGLVEVVGHLPVIFKAFRRLKEILFGQNRPDLLVLIDFPDFNLRLAAQAQRAGIPVLYYISPQVWAWRRGRVKKIAKVVDRLAAVFPFEPDFYAGHDIDVDYVGHPLLDEVHVEMERNEYLLGVGLDPSKPVVGLFPGSRKNEIRYLLETILETGQRLKEARPDVQFLLPVAHTLDQGELKRKVAEWNLPVKLVEGNIYDTIHACDAIATVSGTVTLQIALVGTPMVILYKMSRMTYAIGKRLVKVPHVGLANIVSGRRIVRELIQDEATVENIAGEILRILDDPPYADALRKGLSVVREQMGGGGGSERVARMVSEMIRTGKKKQAL